MKLLLTGFEPFGGSHLNPSEQVVRSIARDGLAGVDLRVEVLPVDRYAGPAKLINAAKAFKPDAILCLGEAGRRFVISIERVAINLLDYRIADNTGHQVVDEPIASDGPAAYFVTLPVRAMLSAARDAGVPAELSLTAGAFLCNQVTYEILRHLAAQKIPTPAGFIHLPPLPEQVANREPQMPSMGLDVQVRGVRAAISAIQTVNREP